MKSLKEAGKLAHRLLQEKSGKKALQIESKEDPKEEASESPKEESSEDSACPHCNGKLPGKKPLTIEIR